MHKQVYAHKEQLMPQKLRVQLMDGSYTDIMTLAVKVDLFQTQSKRPSAAVFFLIFFISFHQQMLEQKAMASIPYT